jgi:hypothetical protein
MVLAMSDNSVDPSGNTEAFRAFTQSAPPEAATSSKTPLIIGIAVAAVIVVGLLVWLLLS